MFGRSDPVSGHSTCKGLGAGLRLAWWRTVKRPEWLEQSGGGEGREGTGAGLAGP